MGVFLKKQTNKKLIWKECIAVFTQALFIIVKTWKQPKGPSTGKADVVHTHTVGYYSAIKENNCVICNTVNGLGGY